MLVGLRDFQDDKCDIIHKVCVKALCFLAPDNSLHLRTDTFCSHPRQVYCLNYFRHLVVSSFVQQFNADEARNLKNYGELPETARINETAVDRAMEGNEENDDIGIDFDEI